MSPEQADDGRVPDGGVLAALPRTRPQRASARRTAARARAQSQTTAQERSGATAAAVSDPPEKEAKASKRKPKKAATAKPAQAGRRAKRAPRASSRAPVAPTQERAPKQGYEPEEEVELGATVHPPSGVEMIESIADIFSELASAGANAGGRLLKDALSVLRRP